MTSLNKVTVIDPNHLPSLLFFYSTEQLKKIQQMCEATEKITKLMSRAVTFTVFPDSSLLFQGNKKCPGKKQKQELKSLWLNEVNQSLLYSQTAREDSANTAG